MIVIALFVFVAIQFYQPPLNEDGGRFYAADFTQSYNINANIVGLLHNSCYDCHSNNTNYRWYDYIQPARILIESHIKEAKEELNFNNWGNYSNRKQDRLLNSIQEQIEKKEMPLSSYTLIHGHARLNAEQIKALTNWFEQQQ